MTHKGPDPHQDSVRGRSEGAGASQRARIRIWEERRVERSIRFTGQFGGVACECCGQKVTLMSQSIVRVIGGDPAPRGVGFEGALPTVTPSVEARAGIEPTYEDLQSSA